MFKDHFFFPLPLFRQNELAFPIVRTNWDQFLAGTLLPPEVVESVIRLVPQGPRERAAAAPIPVPRLFRPLLIVGWEEAMATEVLPYEAVWNRFVTVYVNRYPEHNTHPKRFYFSDEGRDHTRQARRGHLKALYWLLVVRPFQQLIRQNRLGNVDPDTLTPEDIGGGGGHGGPGGFGGGLGGAHGGGGRDAGGQVGQRVRGNGGRGGNPPPPPPQNHPPPPNPHQRSQAPPAPAQSSSSFSSSSSSGTISPSGSQHQQGTCSANSVPVAPAERGAHKSLALTADQQWRFTVAAT